MLDVTSRVVLASRVVRSLSMHLAKLTLDEAVAVLRAQGHHEAILVQQGGAVISPVTSFNRAVQRTGIGCAAKCPSRTAPASLSASTERTNGSYPLLVLQSLQKLVGA